MSRTSKVGVDDISGMDAGVIATLGLEEVFSPSPGGWVREMREDLGDVGLQGRENGNCNKNFEICEVK